MSQRTWIGAKIWNAKSKWSYIKRTKIGYIVRTVQLRTQLPFWPRVIGVRKHSSKIFSVRVPYLLTKMTRYIQFHFALLLRKSCKKCWEYILFFQYYIHHRQYIWWLLRGFSGKNNPDHTLNFSIVCRKLCTFDLFSDSLFFLYSK